MYFRGTTLSQISRPEPIISTICARRPGRKCRRSVKGGGSLLSRSFLLFTLSTVRYRARRPRCGNQQLESRVRENRQHGSEGGEAKAFPTPIIRPLVEPRFQRGNLAG